MSVLDAIHDLMADAQEREDAVLVPRDRWFQLLDAYDRELDLMDEAAMRQDWARG